MQRGALVSLYLLCMTQGTSVMELTLEKRVLHDILYVVRPCSIMQSDKQSPTPWDLLEQEGVLRLLMQHKCKTCFSMCFSTLQGLHCLR